MEWIHSLLEELLACYTQCILQPSCSAFGVVERCKIMRVKAVSEEVGAHYTICYEC